MMKLFQLKRNCLNATAMALGLVLALNSYTSYATETDLWVDSTESQATIDHSVWQQLLDDYIVAKKETTGQPELNLFAYQKVTGDDKKTLKQYLDQLQAVDPRDYSKPEQFAYWVNLYNALTVDLILDNYPVKSITKLGPLLSFGPWDEEVAEVAGEPLTLNDIEHKILRPIWKDPRIHYAVNCASFSCPNLSDQAFTAATKEALLDKAAYDYINHSRGVDLSGKKLKLSKIYKWYQEDFGDSSDGVIDHISQYAAADLKEKLQRFDGRIDYNYDWGLNEPK